MTSKKTAHKRIVLLDSHAIIHRAYHALPEFVNSKGEPTGAIYGLATMLFKIITELKPDYIIACYDLPKKTFRHIAYDDYKAGRAKADDALVSQLISSRNFFKALSIPLYECEGFEADDLLGTIVEKLKKDKEANIIIASGDMDTLQLVDNEKVQVYTLKKGINDTILYNEKKVLERFMFLPKFLPDYKGLRGDPSDNIIGIKGIGEKTATTIINKYGTVEKLYEALKKNVAELKELGLTDRVILLLKNGEDEALFSKTLATIRRDAPIDFELPKNIWKETVVTDDVAQFFRDVEFKSLQNRFLNVLGNHIEEVGVIQSSLSSRRLTSPERGQTVAQGTLNDSKSPLSEIKVDEELLMKAKIAYWLLNSEFTDPALGDIIYYKNSSSFDESFAKLEADIEKGNLGYVYREIELPIIPIIKKMEENGIQVDVDYLKKISKEYHKELEKIEKSIWHLAGREFNINSPKQLGEILFDELKIQDIGAKKAMKKTAGGARSTKESELEKMKDSHPIIAEILKHRELQKLLSTYIDTIPSYVGDDGRLHARFIQTGTTTGRFSSNNPNLQNMPIKTELGKNIRTAFVAAKGYDLVSFDYSQIELRVAALMSQDSYFVESFKQGRDIHSAVAMKVFKVSENDITPEMRRRAKVINFGILYGMGVNALRQNLNCDRKEAQIFYDNYFAEFPTIAGYLASIKNFAKAHGYTETLFGRKRYFPGINSPIPFIQAMALRMATNAPIQGTATADIIKIGMKKAEDALASAGLSIDARMILQVHDELIYEIKSGSKDQAIELIKQALREAIPEQFLKGIEAVPLEVSVHYGSNWGALK